MTGDTEGKAPRDRTAGLSADERRRIARRYASALSSEDLHNLIYEMVKERSDALPPIEALRFLFGLDAMLYNLEGYKSIEYGGGLHTKHRHIRYHDFFVGRVREGERVLDLGCGNGSLCFDVAEKSGAFVVGIDLAAENIETARKRHAHPRVEYRRGDVLADLTGERFDVVILSNVLEHLPDRPDFLKRVLGIAKPSRFLLRVPLFEREWRVPLRKEIGVEWRLDLTHQTEYTLESFAEEMREAGLAIAEREIRWGEIWAEAVPE